MAGHVGPAAVLAAYLIVHRYGIEHPVALNNYSEGIDQTIARFSGRILVRADRFDVLEGDWQPGQGDIRRPDRVTVVEFPDLAKLKARYNSDEYADLKGIRESSASSDIVAVEGVAS